MPQHEETTQEIILCVACKGEGQVSERTSAYDSEMVNCGTCCGSGRMKRITRVFLVHHQQSVYTKKYGK